MNAALEFFFVVFLFAFACSLAVLLSAAVGACVWWGVMRIRRALAENYGHEHRGPY